MHHHPRDEDDLLQRVLSLTYRQLLADARQQPGGSATPQRFSSPAGLRDTRAMILRLCHDHGADTDFIEYVSTRWLGQFEPLLC